MPKVRILNIYSKINPKCKTDAKIIQKCSVKCLIRQKNLILPAEETMRGNSVRIVSVPIKWILEYSNLGRDSKISPKLLISNVGKADERRHIPDTNNIHTNKPTTCFCPDVCATPGCSIPSGCPDGLAKNKYGCEICECAGQCTGFQENDCIRFHACAKRGAQR